MATSKAKKKRLHLERQGKLNPEIKRGSWNGVNPIEKKTPTKKGKLNKVQGKYKWNYSKDTGDGSIIFFANC